MNDLEVRLSVKCNSKMLYMFRIRLKNDNRPQDQDLRNLASFVTFGTHGERRLTPCPNKHFLFGF